MLWDARRAQCLERGSLVRKTSFDELPLHVRQPRFEQALVTADIVSVSTKSGISLINHSTELLADGLHSGAIRKAERCGRLEPRRSKCAAARSRLRPRDVRWSDAALVFHPADAGDCCPAHKAPRGSRRW